jgi:hypothetical protein
LQPGNAVAIRFEEWVHIREASMMRVGLDADVIRRELEEDWGVRLD